MNAVSKKRLATIIPDALANPMAILEDMDVAAKLPDDLERWLGRLKLLYAVPYNYLVADERMLPPESIRFFYVDMNWLDALLDGAFSIGRNLANGTNELATGHAMDAALKSIVSKQINAHAGSIRATALGTTATTISPDEVVSGFLLRSKLVQQYPGMGVNAFLKGQTPDDTHNPQLMPILRFERLGPTSDTLLCLLLGDAYQVEIHEAPEQLHYGIDGYNAAPHTGLVTSATKSLRIFTKTGSQVTIDKSQDPVPLDITSCFRQLAPRTLKIKALTNAIQTKLQLTTFDSAEFGFEMTEGVGNVKFRRNDPSDQITQQKT